MNAYTHRSVRSVAQGDLFGSFNPLPEGLQYLAEVISPDEETLLLKGLQGLSFEPFDFHGHLANRQVAGFGYRYDYASRSVQKAAPIPDFLLPLQERIAGVAGLSAGAFKQVLINEYRPGAGIGWHRDKAHFEVVAGVSLLATCNLRFRRARAAGWEREALTVEPRSIYVMRGPSRHEWEHSISPLDQHRYSITMRTLADFKRSWNEQLPTPTVRGLGAPSVF